MIKVTGKAGIVVVGDAGACAGAGGVGVDVGGCIISSGYGISWGIAGSET